MSQTKAGGVKARETTYRRHGKDFYKRIGSIGGKAPTNKPKGFAANPELAKRAGALGGRISRRGQSKKDKDIEEAEKILEQESGRDKRVTY